MLDQLGEKLRNALKKLAGLPVVDARAVDEFVKELQRTLIAGDVEVTLVFELSKRIRERSLKEEQFKGFSTKDHVLKVIYDELVGIVGRGAQLSADRPLRVMMVGLFGSGKTTTTGKIAKWMKKRGMKVGVIGADVYRPAAREQLAQLARQVGVDFYTDEGGDDVDGIVRNGLGEFSRHEVVIVDTAGRNALDGEMIGELVRARKILQPQEVLLVVSGDIGQEAGRQAREFSKVGLTGVVITKLEGTAKGGGAITSCAAAGAPVKFLGLGEKLDDLDAFEPNGFVSRLLGWGDISALLRKAEEASREIKPQDLLEGEFTLDTFYRQLEAAKNMGPLKSVLQMVGAVNVPDEMIVQSEEKLKKYKYMINSMSRRERSDPEMIDRERMDRIAMGAGVKADEVRELLTHFRTAKKMIKVVKRGRLPAHMIKALGGQGQFKVRMR